MKKNWKKMNVKKIVSVLNCLALSMVVVGAQQCCYWVFHQPDVPVEADKYRKFK